MKLWRNSTLKCNNQKQKPQGTRLEYGEYAFWKKKKSENQYFLEAIYTV